MPDSVAIAHAEEIEPQGGEALVDQSNGHRDHHVIAHVAATKPALTVSLIRLPTEPNIVLLSFLTIE